MTKSQLKEFGFKYICTQTNHSRTQVWAKFTGWKDSIQYYYYFPNIDDSSELQVISFQQLKIYEFMQHVLNVDLFNKDIEQDPENFWVQEISSSIDRK